ncbi:MAG TPA: SLATT domain-containing protein [Bacillota bacterium]|nr:SLATT domain-containing protein [Bacillota bacterium]
MPPKHPPYNEPSAGATLKQKADEQIGSVNSLLSGDFEKTDGKKPPTVPMDLKTYIKDRLNNQEDFYEKAAIKAKKSYFHWRVVQLILGAIVVVLGVMVGLSEKPDKINALIVLISALTGIITSYTISGRYDYLSKSYGGLRRRMRDLAVEGQVSLSPAEFIAKCEIELSAEHRSWLTEWQKSPEANNTQSGNQTIES